MYLGTFSHTLDAKSRFVVPAKVRTQLGEEIVISKGFDGCLELRTAAEFADFAKKMTSFSPTKAKNRTVVRELLANASDLTIDAVGRVLLPLNLMKEASITKEIVIIGVGNKYEIWDADKYAQHKQVADRTFAQLAEEMDEDE